MTTIPSDPLFPLQWHLYNPGGFDLNVVNVWDDYTGNGVLVAVIDDGFDYFHPDLNDNYDATIDYDYNDNDSNPFGTSSNSHGTAVAGIIAAERNGIGGVGVAYDATITGFRATSIAALTNALWDSVFVDVVNNSWGFGNNFFDDFNSPLFSSAGQAIVNAVDNGRGGLGTAIVFAAGNNRTQGDNTNYHNFQNSRHVITVAALNNNGSVSDYSTPGASILVSAFGSPGGSNGTIVTTDRTGSAGYNSGDYTYSFNGTSAAAPMVSGVVALMLEANPNLGYRDIQEILAYSAFGNSAWEHNGAGNWNGGGLHVNHDLGFGLVDALAAVRLAETWQTQSTYSNEYYMTGTRSSIGSIPDGSGTGITSTITMSSALQVDFVEVFLNVNHSYRGDLVVSLISPTGTESILVNRPGNGSDAGDNIVFNLSSSHHWGENSAGTWTLWVRDLDSIATGYFNSWTLSLFGDLETSDDTYVYTNEFSNYTSSSRRTLIDTSGIDTINAAAITSNSYINLTPGTVSTLDGNTLTIGSTTIIEKAFSGDGNDTIIGNSANNTLKGGRGNDSLWGSSGDDTIYGNAGNDTLDGSTGNNTLYGGIGNDVYIVNNDNFVTIFESSGEGIDTVLSSFSNFNLGAASLENLILTGIGNINGTGNNLNNIIIGNLGNNSLNGGVGNDTLDGGAGNDTLDGGTGADNLIGGTGDDLYIVDSSLDVINELLGEGIDTVQASFSYTLDAGNALNHLILTGSANLNGIGNGNNNIIFGNIGNNSLNGSVGDDTLDGGAGNDTLDGGTGADSLIGGTGDDFYIVDSSLDVINELFGEGIDTVQTSLSYTLDAGNALNHLILTGNANLNGIGNGNNNIIFGNLGNNSLNGGVGNDTLDGGAGNDTLNGSTGADNLTGGTGDDLYIVDSSLDVINELFGEGIDTVQASLSYILDAGNTLNNLTLAGVANLNGIGNGNDNIITGTSGNNILDGGDGNDTLNGWIGDDTLYGGAGNDSLVGGAGNNTLYGGTGDDIYTANSDTSVTIVEFSGEGTDKVFSAFNFNLGAASLENLSLIGTGNINGTGNILNNLIIGNVGNNLLNGEDGNDTLNGGNGNDTIYGGFGTDSLLGGNGNDVLDSGTATTFDIANETLDGGAGNDSLIGGDGNDLLIGGAGIDTLRGFAGNDTYLVDNSDSVIENANEGTDTVQTSVNYTLGANLENLTLTATGNVNGTGNILNNVITGNSGNNTLNGGDGNDTLNGWIGDDTLYGGAGNDSLVGGAGNNTLYGGTGDDIYTFNSDTSVTIVEFSGEGTDKVFSAFNFNLGAASLENLSLIGTGNINGTGNTLNNVIIGNAGNNLLNGEDGNDTLNGADGNDTIYGGFGTDSLLGGNGNDVLDSGTETTFDIANETLDGGAGNDSLIAGNGIDILIGGTGNDVLSGFGGNDTLTGGTGVDYFTFNTPNQGIDRITDFAVIDDDIVVSAAGFGGGLIANTFISVSQFVIGATATTASHRFIYNNTNGALWFDQDGVSSAFGQVQIATLNSGLALTNTDILAIA